MLLLYPGLPLKVDPPPQKKAAVPAAKKDAPAPAAAPAAGRQRTALAPLGGKPAHANFGDLQNVPEDELDRAKEAMNADYEAHRTRPNDPVRFAHTLPLFPCAR